MVVAVGTGSFSLQIAEFAAKAKGRADSAVRKVALEVGRRVILRSTPVVDTGRFRANWRFGYDTPPKGIIETSGTSNSPAAPADVAPITEKVLGRVVWWVNNVPYARKLEYGHSQKAQGMVRLTIVEFASIVDGAAREVRSE